jgi:phosphoglycerate dehydrogenase-like enzyme
MAKPKVYIHRVGHWYSQFLDEQTERTLRAFADVVSEQGREKPLSPAGLVERMRGCMAILSLNGLNAEEITADVLRAAGTIRLICIAHYWGLRHFPGITRDTGIPVVEGSNAGTAAVGEWIIAASLMGIRRLHAFDQALKRGSPWGEPRHGVGLLSGSVAGLVGLGRIGRYVAQSFRALGVRCIGYSQSCPPDLAAALGITLVPLEQLLRSADIISLNHRVVDETRGRLGAREFSMLKNKCVFITAARAGLYDERALVDELMKGRFTAYIDVFETEPLPLDHLFRSLRNVVVTPHIAGNNAEMLLRCGRDAVHTLKDFFDGKEPIDKRYAYP